MTILLQISDHTSRCRLAEVSTGRGRHLRQCVLLRAGSGCLSLHCVPARLKALHAHRLLGCAPDQCLHAGQRLPAAVQAAAPARAAIVHKVSRWLCTSCFCNATVCCMFLCIAAVFTCSAPLNCPSAWPSHGDFLWRPDTLMTHVQPDSRYS